jgi:formyltetrahydrofolate synthetase
MIPNDEIFANDELLTLIEGCKSYLKYSGVDPSFIDEQKDKRVESLILIYCKTFYGFKSDGSVKELPKSFDYLVSQLALSSKEEITNVT